MATSCLVTALEVCAFVERHLNNRRVVALSNAALELLAIVAYRQPVAHLGIELIRGSASDSTIATLLERGLIPHNPHHLFVTTCAFLAGLRDLAKLSQLACVEPAERSGVAGGSYSGRRC